MCGIWNYSFDFKQHNWHWLLDIVIPFIFTMALLTVSKWLEHVWGVRQILTLAGEGSICILLLHPLFLDINSRLFGEDANALLLTIINVTECLVLFEILIRFNCARSILGMPTKKKELTKTVEENRESTTLQN